MKTSDSVVESGGLSKSVIIRCSRRENQTDEHREC